MDAEVLGRQARAGCFPQSTDHRPARLKIYFDASVIGAVMLTNPASAAVLEFLDAQETAIPINVLQEFEVKNAVRQKVFRGEIGEGAMVGAFRRFDDMFVRGDFATGAVDFTAVFAEAEQCSRRFCIRREGRAFDVLHVAAAVVSRAREFATFDAKQGELAKAAGLRLIEF